MPTPTEQFNALVSQIHADITPARGWCSTFQIPTLTHRELAIVLDAHADVMERVRIPADVVVLGMRTMAQDELVGRYVIANEVFDQLKPQLHAKLLEALIRHEEAAALDDEDMKQHEADSLNDAEIWF